MRTIQVFGKITSIIQKEIIPDKIQTAKALRLYIEEKYPAMKNLNYAIAVDRKIVADDASLEPTAEVALLPPFAGG